MRLFLSLFLASLAAADGPYRVNEFLDRSLEILKEKKCPGACIVPLGNIVFPGSIYLHDTSLADLSTVYRVGDSYMWSTGRTFSSNGTLSLGHLELFAKHIQSRKGSLKDASIVVGDNLIYFELVVTLVSKVSCRLESHKLRLLKLNDALLYSSSQGAGRINVTDYTRTHLKDLEGIFQTPGFSNFVYKNLNMCDALMTEDLPIINYMLSSIKDDSTNNDTY